MVRLAQTAQREVQNAGRGYPASVRLLEGVVAKLKSAPYLPTEPTTSVKIRNRSYSQWVGREELFERERGSNPDVRGWDACVRVCAGVAESSASSVGIWTGAPAA